MPAPVKPQVASQIRIADTDQEVLAERPDRLDGSASQARELDLLELDTFDTLSLELRRHRGRESMERVAFGHPA